MCVVGRHYLCSHGAKWFQASMGNTKDEAGWMSEKGQRRRRGQRGSLCGDVQGAELPSHAVSVFAAVCCIFFIVAGVVGNLLTLIALRRHRAPNTAFVLNLAAVDLAFCALSLPPTAARFLARRWPLGESICSFFPLLFYGNVGISVTSLACVAVSRYVLVARPALYQRMCMNPRRLAMLLVATWLFGLGMLVPPLFRLWGQFGLDEANFSCTILADQRGKSPKKFLFIFGLVFPVTLIIIFNGCIFLKVRQSARTLATHGQANPHPLSRPRLNKREARMTMLMFLTFVAFLVCFLPLTICNMLEKTRKVSPDVSTLASVLAWMSACINPVLYVAVNRQYRRAILSLVCPRSRLGLQSPSTGSTGESMGTLRRTTIKVCPTPEILPLKPAPVKLPGMVPERQNGDVGRCQEKL
ncbi:hypothetical protein LAZ67_3004027 [Cordylochernes scorpioides]|uniref:G-protein coupled receptors family 1 profile domain-containing protein n=1 Tax=Cordylochernes scorpioides TaxID=51811 RepID=A0ABY6KBX2_9ARAC|nr:hypothetical protein LAZ67_3004027 [Cordylochernes scorpioides]